MRVRVGKVSGKGKLHLDVNGLAHCGAGTGRIIAGTVVELETTDNLCRNCVKRVRVLLDDYIYHTAAVSPRDRARAAAVQDTIRTDAELRWESEMLDRLADSFARTVEVEDEWEPTHVWE